MTEEKIALKYASEISRADSISDLHRLAFAISTDKRISNDINDILQRHIYTAIHATALQAELDASKEFGEI